MGAGNRRSRVRFEAPVTTPDGYGGDVQTWETYWEGWGEIERQRSFNRTVERVMAGGVGSTPIVRIHVPFDELTGQMAAIGQKMRALNLDTGVFMNVNSAEDITNRRQTMTVTATENAPS